MNKITIEFMRLLSISISSCIALFILNGCSHEALEENIITLKQYTPLIIQAAISGFDDSEHLQTRATENGYKTEFATDDAIGIFVIKDGAIVDGINNVRLTYSDGNWNPPAGTTFYYYADADYIAYYPYKDGISIEATQTKEEIIASFAEKTELQPGDNQRDNAVCDLMVADGAITNGSTANEKKLTLNFQHQFALLVIKQVLVEYTSPNATVFTYLPMNDPLVESGIHDVVINGKTAYLMSDGSYRAIIKTTTTAIRITGKYQTADDKTFLYTGSEIASGFTTGNYYTIQVKRLIERPLAPGDYYFENNGKIEIYPGNVSGTIPNYKNAIGIIVTSDPSRMTDEVCNAQGWNHAYVLGFKYTSGCMWGASAKGVDEPIPNSKPSEGAADNMNGYTETETMLTTYSSSFGDLSTDLNNYGAFKQILLFRNNNPVPDGINRSQWFIPSVGQWYDALRNLGKSSPETWGITGRTGHGWMGWVGKATLNNINSLFSRVGQNFSNGVGGNARAQHWCSSEGLDSEGYAAIYNYTYTDEISLATQSEGVNNNNGVGFGNPVVRPFFAF